MSIVYMECSILSIAMYYTKRSGGRSSEKSENAKTEWEVACLFRKLLFASGPLPPGPLDTKSVISRPVPIMILLSGGPSSTAGSIPTRI